MLLDMLKLLCINHSLQTCSQTVSVFCYLKWWNPRIRMDWILNNEEAERSLLNFRLDVTWCNVKMILLPQAERQANKPYSPSIVKLFWKGYIQKMEFLKVVGLRPYFFEKKNIHIKILQNLLERISWKMKVFLPWW